MDTCRVRSGGRWRFVVVALTMGPVVTALGGWQLSNRHSVTPDVIEGWAVPNAEGTAVSLHDSNDDRPGNSYVIAGARWAGPDNSWHDGGGGPTCAGTDTNTRIHVQMGIVDVDAAPIGGPYVVWLRCLVQGDAGK
ncbi:MAG: hypothetical protein JOZ47_01660 [Kutzneria sp.]|nr:hypothetical protein [Kutzneria sp.]